MFLLKEDFFKCVFQVRFGISLKRIEVKSINRFQIVILSKM